MGELQEGRGVVDDVLLPPWAQGDAFEFVRLHREALESDYVSEVFKSFAATSQFLCSFFLML